MPFESARGLTFPTSAVTAQAVFAAIGANGQIAAAGANAPGVVGVTLEATALATDDVPYAAGDTISVAAMDGARVEVLVGTGGIVAGADVTSGAGGTAVAATTGNRIFGYAVADANDTEIGTIILLKGALAAP